MIPFSLQLPYETPITIGDVSVWMKTEMDVTFALDPKDNDYINVFGNETVSSFLKAIESLGFYLNKVKNVPFKRSKTGVFQEFEYKPKGGPFQRSLDEVEIGFVADAQSVDLFIEVDRKARGLSGFWKVQQEWMNQRSECNTNISKRKCRNSQARTDGYTIPLFSINWICLSALYKPHTSVKIIPVSLNLYRINRQYRQRKNYYTRLVNFSLNNNTC
ncbi:sporulation protein [[Brevibacterium] frigoritolerans]|uniref:Sporulation protein n=1 Tax=Peribacillus frigoritolerans TaxID=450367 RepID=A0A941J2G1_9BACI|nr:sporulation protein [Peribacillus frigoritolerans]